MNKSDSERIATKLEKKKYQPAININQANLIVINICSVRQSAINRVNYKIEKIKEENPKAKIALTGCILEKDKRRFKGLVDQIWPMTDLEIKPQCQSETEAFLPIMTGCNNFCSYCAVPYTRGREKSRRANEIIKEIKGLIKKGFKKIILLGQNVNSYSNGKYDFPKLLKEINQIEGNFKISFLTSHPKDFSDELIEIISKSKKISKEIHLPIQSGDNEILKKMNRGYAINQCKKLIKKIRNKIPNVKISTDIIVGFPNETEKQFQNTVQLVKEMNFYQIYTSSYSSRPGTTAFKLKDNIDSKEKKRRKRLITSLIKNK